MWRPRPDNGRAGRTKDPGARLAGYSRIGGCSGNGHLSHLLLLEGEWQGLTAETRAESSRQRRPLHPHSHEFWASTLARPHPSAEGYVNDTHTPSTQCRKVSRAKRPTASCVGEAAPASPAGRSRAGSQRCKKPCRRSSRRPSSRDPGATPNSSRVILKR